MSALTDDTTGICYTWSGDKKKYESDLFSAELHVFSHEYCHRYDSYDNRTLVFGESDGDHAIDKFSTYLPYGGVSINHNIQDNGEDHYSLSGTYTKPKNWSPPAGLDGPFDGSNGLKYPYYVYVIGWTTFVSTKYNGENHNLDDDLNIQYIYYYGNKE